MNVAIVREIHPGAAKDKEDGSMKRFLVLLAMFTMLGAGFASPLWAEEHAAPDPIGAGNFSHEYAGEFILFDVIIMRPVSLAASVLGLGGAVIGYPWAVASDSEDRLFQELIEKPVKFTFSRPVGEVDF